MAVPNAGDIRSWPREEETAPHSSILSERIPWTEKRGGLQSWTWLRVWAVEACTTESLSIQQKLTQYCQSAIHQLKNTHKNKLPNVRRLISDRLWTWNSIQSWTLSIQPFQRQDGVKSLQWSEFSLRGSQWSHSLDCLLQQADGIHSSLKAKRLQTQEGLMFQLKFKGRKS